jgi:hypothetical protein
MECLPVMHSHEFDQRDPITFPEKITKKINKTYTNQQNLLKDV